MKEARAPNKSVISSRDRDVSSIKRALSKQWRGFTSIGVNDHPNGHDRWA